MHIFSHIRSHIISALDQMEQQGSLPEGLSFDAITAEPPRDLSHGDVATNAAMVLAKPAKQSPRDIAQTLAELLQEYEEIAEVSVAGPGFINMRLVDNVWQQVVQSILEQGVDFGNLIQEGEPVVNVEFVSANPTGPMHVGHARGAIFGDTLARLYDKAGYKVVREFYVNDAGAQVDVLARSVFLRYKEALGETIEIPEGLYPGEYLVPVGQALKEKYGDSLLTKEEAEWLPDVRAFAIDAMLDLIRKDLKLLGVEHNIFSSEAALHAEGKVEKALKLLESKGLIYQGVLEPPKGKTPEDWEPREQTLFRATNFGDDVDRPLKKSDGSWTYFASDIAYHLDKLERGFNHMVLELGKDHGGYLKRMKAAVAAISDEKAHIDIVFHDLVNYMEKGAAVKMSKRKGTFLTVGDVVEMVDKDILRFVMLTRKNDAVLDFDLQKVKEQSKDNPVFYVQYAHARCCSVLRNAEVRITANNVEISALALLTHETELALIRLLASWPRIVESSAATLEPHRIAFYLQEVAAAFHALWNKGKEEDSLRFIIDDNDALTYARLALVKAVSVVIASGLKVFNVEPAEEMQ